MPSCSQCASLDGIEFNAKIRITSFSCGYCPRVETNISIALCIKKGRGKVEKRKNPQCFHCGAAYLFYFALGNVCAGCHVIYLALSVSFCASEDLVRNACSSPLLGSLSGRVAADRQETPRPPAPAKADFIVFLVALWILMIASAGPAIACARANLLFCIRFPFS